VCKAQFCSYRDRPDEFAALGATVVGISAQDVASHQGFVDKNNLTVPLLADVDGAVAKLYSAHGHRHDHLDKLDQAGRISLVRIHTEDVRMHSTISEKGQITVPKPLRDRLGIRAGDRLEFVEGDGGLVLRKVTGQDPVEAVYGILSLGESTDDTLRTLRGDPDAV
jgi:antitoxin PrlF